MASSSSDHPSDVSDPVSVDEPFRTERIQEKSDDRLSEESPREPQELYSNGPEAENDGASTYATNSLRRRQSVVNSITSVITGRSIGHEVPKMGGGREYPPLLPNRDPYRVEFDGPNDPMHPHNWTMKNKIIIAVVLGYSTLCTAWGSAVFAAAVPGVSEHFKVGEVTATLGISLYVLGFASGPVLWAPLSELYGRKMPIIVSMFGLTVFSFAVASAKDLQTVMLCRFFGGFIGAAPLAVVAAAFADMFNNQQRGMALIIFGGTVFAGPIAAPVIGGFIAANETLGWRWTEYITGIMSALALVLDLVLYKESYHPVILTYKAQEIRRVTGNWGVYAAHEDVELDLQELVTKNLVRPITMLVTEPILLLLTIYTAFIYGILYLFLEAYPLVFSEKYHFTGGIVELPYLGLVVGMLIAMFAGILIFEPRYNKAMAANGGKPVPEARLPNMIVGSVLFPVGLFWFTWSGNYPEQVPWIVPTLSGLFTGYGLLAIFMCAINYIVDCYLVFAASALAGNTFLRSGFGAVFPLFATAMFNNLGVNWAGTLIGCIGFLLMPVPFLFYKYGKKIRQRSKYAFDL